MNIDEAKNFIQRQSLSATPYREQIEIIHDNIRLSAILDAGQVEATDNYPGTLQLMPCNSKVDINTIKLALDISGSTGCQIHVESDVDVTSQFALMSAGFEYWNDDDSTINDHGFWWPPDQPVK